MNQPRRRLFIFVLLLIVFVFSELGSWLILRFLETRPLGAAIFIVRRSQPNRLGELIRQQTLDPFFDQELGWSRRKASQTKNADGTVYTFMEDGSRFCGNFTGKPSVAFYGCSGTMGLEVTDSECFPSHVAQVFQTPVKNWGTLGYGVDQSLLLFEQKLKEGKDHPKIVFLGMGTEAINRNVSAWRLFYSGENLLKPRLMQTEKGLMPQNPLLFNPSTYFVASDSAILKAIAPYDYWLTSKAGKTTIIKPATEFPFTWSLCKASFYLLGKFRAELAFPGRPLQTPFNLYDQKEPLALLQQIVDRFYADCETRGFKGYLILITGGFYVEAAAGNLESDTLRLKRGQPRKLDENFIRYLDERKYPYIDTMPIFLKVLKEEGTMKSMFCPYEHPSPRATKMIADAIVARMRQDQVISQASSNKPSQPEKVSRDGKTVKVR